jgi:hypothetical protein
MSNVVNCFAEKSRKTLNKCVVFKRSEYSHAMSLIRSEGRILGEAPDSTGRSSGSMLPGICAVFGNLFVKRGDIRGEEDRGMVRKGKGDGWGLLPERLQSKNVRPRSKESLRKERRRSSVKDG